VREKWPRIKYRPWATSTAGQRVVANPARGLNGRREPGDIDCRSERFDLSREFDQLAFGFSDEAYGFDLSPLAQRVDEFIRLAATARRERQVASGLRKRKSIARRAIHQAGETLADLGRVPEGWSNVAMETARLSGLPAESSSQLASIVDALEAYRAQVEAWVKEAADCSQSSPQGLKNDSHTADTKLTSNLIDTVTATQESKPPPSPAHPQSRRPASENAAGITAPELLELAPRLRSYLRPGIDQTWRTLGPAAAWLAGELKISRVAWEEACRCVGQERATVMVAL
jgi:replication initiation protein RepC